MSELLYSYYLVNNCLQCLHVGGETRDTHEAAVIDLEDTLEVGIDGHQLGRQASVGRNSNTVLARHSNHHITVVIEDRLYRSSYFDVCREIGFYLFAS